MKFYKYFTLTILSVVCVGVIYLGMVIAYKQYQKEKIKHYYASEHNIALEVSTVNQPLQAAKYIPESQPVRILVLEGGGLDGIISAKLLDFLEKNSGKRISDLFDIISGTSVGALQSTMLTIPDQNNRPKYSAADVLNVLRNNSPTALEISSTDLLSTGFGLISPVVDTTTYIQMLKYYIGDLQLSQLRSNVIFDGYDILNRQVMFFSSRQSQVANENFLVYQLLSAITAIPGIMPPQEITSISNPKMTYLIADPGMIMNNPILAALQYAQILYPKHKKILVFLGMGLDEKFKPKPAVDYYNGTLGALAEYYDMTWSHDKLLKRYFAQVSKAHLFNISELFFVDENLDQRISSINPTAENIRTLESVGDLMIQHQKQQLLYLISHINY